MRRIWVLLPVVVTAVSLVTTASPAAQRPFRATLTTDGHTPKIIVKWWYTVRVTDLSGRAMGARITARIKDPIGGIHQVQFGRDTTKDVKNYPIVGRFRDWVNWPRDSAIGITLVFQVVVKTAKGSTVLSYSVTPHA